MYSRNYALGTPWLDKCLKSPVSEDPSKSNMVKWSKYCSNLNHSTFGIFLNRSKLTQPIQMQLSKKEKTFSQLFSAFLKLH